MENKNVDGKDNLPAQSSEDQQISPEESGALPRTPTPGSICPVSSPTQRPVRIRQQRYNRKFLLAIPAITVIAVAAVVLFYAITWNDTPPTQRDEIIKAHNEEVSRRKTSGRILNDQEPLPPGTRPPHKFSSDRQQSDDTREPSFQGPMLRELPRPNAVDEGVAEDEVGSEDSTRPAGREKKKMIDDNNDELLRDVPWPSYADDLNLTDEELDVDDLLFKVDKLQSAKTPRHPFFIDLVESPKNFTDAHEYCQNREGYLMLLFTTTEELYFSRVVAENELFHSKCKSGFLGFRRILQEDIKVRGKTVATFADPLSYLANIWVEPQQEKSSTGGCVILHHNATNNTFGLTRESCDTRLKCFLCETARGCKLPACYYWHYKMETTVNYEEAQQSCQKHREGFLARIRTRQTLDAVKRAVNATKRLSLFSLYSEQACNGVYYVDKEETSLGQLGFESVEEQQIRYRSPAILSTMKNTPKIESQCLAVSKENGYRWMFVPCSEKKCFFCRYDLL